MAHSSAHAGGLLPRGVAIAWIAALLAVIVAHCRPLIATRGRARTWHALHLAMAATMVLMYVSASVVGIGVSGRVWTIAFAALAALAAGMLAAQGRDRVTDWLWALAVADLLAMTYMLRSGRPIAAISWLLAIYLAAQAALWVTPTGGRLIVIGHLPAAPAQTVALRLGMVLMAASMVCMLAAMQLSAY